MGQGLFFRKISLEVDCVGLEQGERRKLVAFRKEIKRVWLHQGGHLGRKRRRMWNPTVREKISIILSYPVCDTLLKQPRK